MKIKQSPENGLIVGIDLSKYHVQVSCLSLKDDNVETISTQMGVEKYEIPLCLLKKPDTQGWYYGDKARLNRYSENSIYIEDLWEGVLNHREIVLEEETYSYEKLMTVFMEKILKLILQCGYTQKISALVFTTADMNYEKIIHLRNITHSLPVEQKCTFFIDYKESFSAYVTSDKKELWNHDVFLFHYSGRDLKAFQLRVNQKMIPFQIKIGEMDYGELEYGKEELEDSEDAREEMDSRFMATIEEAFEKKIVSSVYLIGDGFQPGWMKHSLRMLCRGRRVFQGNNLFTKGACYAGKWYLGIQKPVGEYYSGQMLACDVKIPVINGTAKEYLYAAKKGTPWYIAGLETQCLADGTDIEIILDSIGIEKAKRTEKLELQQFPQRPSKASRICVKVDFLNESTGRIRVEDMGFGEFYLPSGLKWEMEFMISNEGEGSKEAKV